MTCGNIKQREYIKENPIESMDVVQYTAPYNNDLMKNRQQKLRELVQGKYEVVGAEGD